MAFYHVLLCFPEQFQTSPYLQPTTAGPLSLTAAEQQATVQREHFLFNNRLRYKESISYLTTCQMMKI